MYKPSGFNQIPKVVQEATQLVSAWMRQEIELRPQTNFRQNDGLLLFLSSLQQSIWLMYRSSSGANLRQPWRLHRQLLLCLGQVMTPILLLHMLTNILCGKSGHPKNCLMWNYLNYMQIISSS